MPSEDTLLSPRSMTEVDADRRREKRIYLQIPLFVRVRDAHGNRFMELAKTLDVSALGALLASPRQVTLGEVVTLTIPAPSITSNALIPAGMPPLQAKVVRQKEVGDVHLIGVEFFKAIG
jgi:hypothetical protein